MVERSDDQLVMIAGASGPTGSALWGVMKVAWLDQLRRNKQTELGQTAQDAGTNHHCSCIGSQQHC